MAGNYKPRPAAQIEEELGASPAMARHLAAVAKEVGNQVDMRQQRWISRAKGRSTIRTGARITGGQMEGYMQVQSPFWHIDEFGTEHTPAAAPIRRGAEAALRQMGGQMKEQTQ